jgi:hypothetical protein
MMRSAIEIVGDATAIMDRGSRVSDDRVWSAFLRAVAKRRR